MNPLNISAEVRSGDRVTWGKSVKDPLVSWNESYDIHGRPQVFENVVSAEILSA